MIQPQDFEANFFFYQQQCKFYQRMWNTFSYACLKRWANLIHSFKVTDLGFRIRAAAATALLHFIKFLWTKHKSRGRVRT